ncbi:unnamed protein product [Arctogadus glacialis]
MSLERTSDDARLLAPFEETRAQKRISVYDRRSIDGEAIIVETSGLDYNQFLRFITEVLIIPSTERFVLTTTDRTMLDFDKFQELEDGNTLHLMQTEHQELPAATQEKIVFTPHYDTLVRSGMYEYYASEGQMALPYALAELIDNSISATASSKGERSIELRLLFDDTLGKPAVVFVDNGSGMTSKQLNNWAVYRLSKFTREDGKFRSDHQGYTRPEDVSRSINSDISCFGVGGKQAIFYIGNSTRMITRPTGSPDVHELILSKEDFESKAMNNEDIYSGFIHNRKVGDSSHVQKESECFLHNLIAEETEKGSFTAVVITGIPPEHAQSLKNDFDKWTRELAHIYHYYIHGLNGNDLVHPLNSNINIEVSLQEKPPRCPRVVNLREVDNDMQTLYINSAADTFEFKACTPSGGAVDGVLRYHPFLYDRETYPQGPHTHPAPTEDELEDGESGAGSQADGRRHIFECFWNGRLIPYTTLSEFEWCKRPGKHSPVPLECYSRLSGVLFANDRFQVSTNKLTFIDLELQLQKKDTIFTRIVNGQEQRVQIKREFSQWLTGCHERLDKQVHFVGFKKTITRAEMQTKKMQYPWATFSSIEWDNKTFKTGQLVKSLRTQPILYGYIVQFLLYGDHDSDIYATNGMVEISLEPKEVYDECRTFLISKIDRTATNASIQKFIDTEMNKMPDKLQLVWPEGNALSENAVMHAGDRLGPLKVSILNKKGEEIARMPQSNQGARKLVMELRLVCHGPNGAQVIQTHTAQHSPKWSFWFKAMGTATLTKLGQYTLELNTMLNDTKMFGGKTLPSHQLNLTITEGKAERFVVEAFTSTLRVGVANDMVLTLLDAFDHPAPAPPLLTPELSCRNLIVSYETTSSSGTQFTIHGVKVSGSVPNYHCKARDLNVVLPGLESSSQTIKISLLPGYPHSLDVTSEKETFTVENGNPMTFNIKVLDEAGNITAQPKLVVYCRVPQHTPISVDCSTTGAGQLITKPITARNLNEQQRVVKAKFDLPSQKQVSAVWKELIVVPSTRVSRLEVYFQDAGGLDSVLRNEEQVEWKAGDLLENLHYRLYDEGQRLLPLDQHTARSMKVNWLAEVNLEDLARGKLPYIQVPTQVTNKPFYQISYKDQRASVDASFILVPCPDVPSQLKVTLEHSSVTMGEVLPGDIHLQLLDQHGNVTQKLTPQCVDAIKVEGVELDSTSLTVLWQESSKDVVVRGVRFSPGKPGPRELTFTLRTFTGLVKVTLTAGPPAALQLLSGPQLPLQVFNGQGIPSPFLIQLCDAWGNPSPDKRVVVALTSSSPSLEVKCPVMSKPVDREGKASFSVERIAGPKGEFSLEFRGLFNQRPIPGPSIQLTVVLDPSKPARLVVDYDTNTICPAGEALPVFSVSVLSEEGGPIRNVNPAALSMMLWRIETTSLPTPPSGAIQFKCSKPLENEADDFHFYFRDKPGAEQTGKYSLQFSLTSGRTILKSKQYVLDVVANEPIKLAPDSQPTTPIVSNVEAPDSRVLVKDLSLRIRDRFGNPAGLEVDGQVEVRVELSPEDGDKELPTLEAPSHLQLTKGTAHVSKLSINRDSPGINGAEYVLMFQIRGPGMTLAPYLLPFRFYNDAENQKLMSELARKKDRLSGDLVKFREYSKNLEDLRRELTCKNQQAAKKVTELKSELSRRKVNVTQLKSDLEVRTALSEKIAQFNRISGEPRRTCAIADPYRGDRDFLGKVGQLALVEDDASARVISWHIQGDMDCLVTVTTAAARQVYDRTGGAQQVLPLDSIYVNPTDRPLPHLGCRTPTPPGNPVFARDLLIYPNDTESCKKVFKNLLGDTILIDDLDAGNAYRKSVVQSNRSCPTILTRRGERIGARGKFGGAQNRAPALSALQGRVFGAPHPALYHTLSSDIGDLQGYLEAFEASKKAKEELNDHVQKLRSPENMEINQAMDENKRKLTEIESQLERTPVSTSGRRALREEEEAAGPPQKRPRASAQRTLQ